MQDNGITVDQIPCSNSSFVFCSTFDICHKGHNCKAILSIMRHFISNKPAVWIMKPLVMIKIIMYDTHTGKCKDETNRLNYFKFIL